MGREHVGGGQASQRQVLRIQLHQVRPLAHGQPGDGAATGLRSSGGSLQQHGGGDLRVGSIGQHVPASALQALAIFEQHQFLGGVHRGVAVRAQAPGTAVFAPQGHVKNAVAQVGFGAGANARHRATACGTLVFGGRHMGGVHQAPVGVDLRIVQQPLHRALAAPGQTGINLAGLLGNVDVYWRGGIQRMQARQGVAQALRRHSTQRVRCQPQARALRRTHRLQPLQQLEHRIGAADKPALPIGGRSATKATRLVQHRQQGDTDTHRVGSAQQRQGQRGVVRVRATILCMVDVMELAHRGVARLQHFDVEPGGNGFHLFGRQRGRKAVHQGAPAPEAVVCTVSVLAPVFGQTGKGALERMGVQIGQAGNDRAAG